MVTLEELVNQKRAIKANSQAVEAAPNESYAPRKNIGAILNSEYPVDYPDPDAYLNKESVTNEYISEYIKDRDNEIKEIVKQDPRQYLSKIDAEAVAKLAVQLDKEYMEIASAAGNHEKMYEMIGKYAAKPQLCLDLISTNYNPSESLMRCYKALLDVKALAIEDKEGLYEISEKKKVYSKKITENYFMKNLDASDEKLKDKAYLAIAEMYCR